MMRQSSSLYDVAILLAQICMMRQMSDLLCVASTTGTLAAILSMAGQKTGSTTIISRIQTITQSTQKQTFIFTEDDIE